MTEAFKRFYSGLKLNYCLSVAKDDYEGTTDDQAERKYTEQGKEMPSWETGKAVDIRAYMHEYKVGILGPSQSFMDLPEIVGDAASLVNGQHIQEE